MKRIVSTFFVLLSGMFAVAQNVGIGTAIPHNSALPDLQSTSKGVLGSAF